MYENKILNCSPVQLELDTFLIALNDFHLSFDYLHLNLHMFNVHDQEAETL